ncbi:ABC transporter substrate-binding protein [Curtobacterium sp. 'Ferrero']|uniref:ABC transporter substrate-binding protein n=1 Tax=Curtobacterium sp. 'Ferrero' TaxID=2033654 RepID=UPI000BC7B993|nr:ABC transporter substrate-binding protein [Curtobacterium sp. 'Ferrero']PCN48153.1 ABC transporter substrate-binding protein [Curtobacterium sp. 'Ferrero']
MLFTTARRRRRLTAVAAGLATITALALSGCSSTSSGAGTSSITVFNGATGTIAENWNPFSPSMLQPTQGVIYEPLYYYNLASTSKPQPELATGFSWNDAGTQLTITTRKDVTWTDGKPFSASDVAFTFNLIHDTPALNTSGLNATAKATNSDTVVLTFPEKSFTQEPQILGNQAIVPEHIWSKVKDPTTTINANPVGTGPYKLQSFNAQSYVLTKNTKYWQPGKPAIDTVRYISLSNADAASAALLSGKVDWMSSFLPNLKQLLANHKELSYVNTPALTTSLFACSNADLGCTGPQTDPAVRRAIYQAIDRTQLNKLAGGGFAAEASPTMLLPDRDEQWIAKSEDRTAPQEADTSGATTTLADAGWTKGSDGILEKDGQRLSMTVQVVAGYSDYISAIQVMQTELKKVGIELKSNQLSYNEWSNNETKGDFQLTMDSIGLGASSNPFYTYNPRYSSKNTAKVGTAAPSGGNFARYSNATVDKALTTAAATNDESVQREQYATVQEQIVRDLPYIPIYVNSTLTEFNTSRATGWPTNDDKYAFPASWKSWDNGIVLKNLKPAK